MKKHFLSLFSILFAAMLALAGCSSIATEDKGNIFIVLPSAPTRDMNEINFTVSLCDITETMLLEKKGKSGDTIVFESVLIGNYVVKIECFDSTGASIGKGVSQCTVEADKTTSLKIKIKLIQQTPDPDNPIVDPDDPIIEPDPDDPIIEPNPDESESSVAITITVTFKPYENPIALEGDYDTVTAPEGFAEYKWFYDGKADDSVAGNVYSNTSLVGKHTITVMAKDADGKIYSENKDVNFHFKISDMGLLLLEDKTVTAQYDPAIHAKPLGLIFDTEIDGNYAKVLGIMESKTTMAWFASDTAGETSVSIPELLVSYEIDSDVYHDFSCNADGILNDASSAYECAKNTAGEDISKYKGLTWAHEYGLRFHFGTAFQDEWYLPSIIELEEVIRCYDEETSDGVKATFNTLNAVEETFMDTDEFMSSSLLMNSQGEYEQEYFYYKKGDDTYGIKQHSANGGEYNLAKVRAIRKVSVQE